MSKIILDTNIISEAMRRKPDAKVMRWMTGQVSDNLYLTSIALAELWRGVERLPDDHSRKSGYSEQIKRVTRAFEGRILSFDAQSARIWGRLMGQHARKGRALAGMDMQIASLAIQHGMTLATRNIKDFRGLGLEIANPFH